MVTGSVLPTIAILIAVANLIALGAGILHLMLPLIPESLLRFSDTIR